MLDIRPFAGHVVPAGNLFAKIRIAQGMTGTIILKRIGSRIITQPIFGVELQHENATAPGPVSHPQLPLFIIKHTGVDGMRQIIPPAFTTVVA